jgi:hypothetical protein
MHSEANAAGAALSTMFSPLHAPKRKTMGLLQRSFVDLANRSDDALEIAVVVDGTESMAGELSAVRDSVDSMLDDLQRSRSSVKVAIIVYRDSLSPSGETQSALNGFTSDRAAIDAAVKLLQPESGEPYFHELADVGLHTALTTLPWSEDPAITRWVLWFGDAPPYEESFRDPAFPGSRRRYGNELLIAVANRKSIQINAVICKSGDNVAEPFAKTIDSTRTFIGELVAGTDGLLLDLSYPDIRQALINAGKQPTVQYTEIGPITARDLESVEGQRASASEPLPIAVLPYQAIDQMSFDPRSPEVQIATAIRHRLGLIPGIQLTSPLDVQRQIKRMRAEGVAAEEQMRGLAARLGVDFVVWGKAEPPTNVRTVAYRRSDGGEVLSIASDARPDLVAEEFISAAATSQRSENVGSQPTGLESLAARVQALRASSPVEGHVAESPAAAGELLAGLESLEQALAYEVGSLESIELLDQAERALESAIKTEPQNALGHWLLSNVLMNQAAGLFSSSQNADAGKKLTAMRSALRRAHRYRERLSSSLAQEIEADEALLIRGDHAAALAGYETLAQDSQPLATQLRAHWMLAGLYAGDWGVGAKAAELVEAAKVRKHVIQILVRWPDSPQATLLRQWLQWDDDTGKSRYYHFPQTNDPLASLDG